METLVSKPQIIQNDHGYLVLPDLAFGDTQEVTRSDDGSLGCDCFTFTVLNQECEHIEAVRQWIGDYQLPEMSQADADHYLNRLTELDSLKASNTASAELQIARIKQWLEAENAILDRKRFYFEQALSGWMLDNHFKTRRLVNGTLKLRSQPLTIDILDEDQVMADERFVRVTEKRSVDKKALREHVTQTGEEIPGTRVEITLPKFSYSINPT